MIHKFLSPRGLDVRSLDGGLHEMLHVDFSGLGIVMNMAQSPYIRPVD